MRENNKKYFYVNKLRDALESRGWKVFETEFLYSGNIYIGSVLMQWDIQRSTIVKPVKIEFIAAQIEYYVTADPYDFDYIKLPDLETNFFFTKKRWDNTVKEMCLHLDKVEQKLKTEYLSARP